LIASGKNYEEEFKLRTNGTGERCTKAVFKDVLNACRVSLTSDENNALESLMYGLRDQFD